MKHDKLKNLLVPYSEGSLNQAEKKLVLDHLAECQECSREFEQLNKLEEVLTKMEFRKPSDEVWDVYWSSVYNKLERKLGWIVFSIGIIIMLGYIVYQAMADFINNPETPILLKIGVLTFVTGGIILFVSVLKEQLFFKKKQRYKEIER